MRLTTSTTPRKINPCSKPTATRDSSQLVQWGLITINGSGKATPYVVDVPGWNAQGFLSWVTSSTTKSADAHQGVSLFVLKLVGKRRLVVGAGHQPIKAVDFCFLVFRLESTCCL
jgi:hypothetical protein